MTTYPAARLLSDIEYRHHTCGYWRIMKHIFLSLFTLGILTGAAQAACYADYKAKMDGPLRLQYGVAEITGACTRAQAETELQGRLAADGWELLEVQDVFDESGLEERRERAGEYYLRY